MKIGNIYKEVISEDFKSQARRFGTGMSNSKRCLMN